MKKSVLISFLLINLANANFIRDTNKEIVTDTSSKLMWQDNNEVNTTIKSWSDSIDYCENLTLGGYTNWHLPNYNELYSLADRNKYNPAINDTFVNVNKKGYWSSTTDVSDSFKAYVIDFSYGNDLFEDKINSKYTICVHSINN